MLTVNHGHAVVALDNAVGGLHRGAFVVSNVALPGAVPTAAGLVVVFSKPGSDLFDLGPEGFGVLFFLFYNGFVRFGLVHLAVTGDDLADGFFHLLFLMLQLFLGPAPLLGGVRGQLAAVHREHFLADQAHFVTDQKHFEEKLDRFLVIRGDEVSYGGEVRPGVCGEGHEDNIIVAAFGDLPAGGYSLGIGVEDDL